MSLADDEPRTKWGWAAMILVTPYAALAKATTAAAKGVVSACNGEGFQPGYQRVIDGEGLIDEALERVIRAADNHAPALTSGAKKLVEIGVDVKVREVIGRK